MLQKNHAGGQRMHHHRAFDGRLCVNSSGTRQGGLAAKTGGAGGGRTLKFDLLKAVVFETGFWPEK